MGFAKNGSVRLRATLADSKVTLAMKEGRVSSSLIDFDFCGPAKARQGFKPMLRENAFDAGEMAIVTFLQAKAYGKPFVLLPVTLSGRFQHYTIGYNADFGAMAPKDIEGRKVGLRTYSQTTSVWVKGILQHEYDVDLDKVTWLTVTDSHLLEHKDPPNCVRLPPDAALDKMLLNGETAAGILGDGLPKEPQIRPLIPDPAAAAQEWYRREGVVPINHMLVVHQDLARERPDVIRELYRLFAESRAMAPDGVAAKLPPLGMEANRKALEMAIDWSLEQKVIPRRLSIDELFDETTRTLN
jgi:4,5-dihydroxyphthalate decarboxylase